MSLRRLVLSLLVLVAAVGAGVLLRIDGATQQRAGSAPVVSSDAGAAAAAPERHGRDGGGEDPGADAPVASPAPARVAAPSPPAGPPPGSAALVERLESVLGSPGLELGTAQLAVAVRDADGRPLLDRGSRAALLPASTQKLVTAATALEVLGPAHRFVTTVGTAGEVARGTLFGDLVVRGVGDPVLATREYERHVYAVRPRTPLEELADGIVAAGVERVSGDVVADTSVFAGPTLADGWPRHYLEDFDARHITGLTVNAGLTVELEGDEPELRVRLALADDPAEHTARVLRELLRDRGVVFLGDVRSTPTPAPAPEQLAAVESPPLRRLLEHMIQRSDNHLADTLFRTVGAAAGGDGSWASGAAAARQVLAELGVATEGLVLADGSGLSRTDRLTAAALAELDATMHASRWRGVWRSTMAVAGEAGTLRGRLQGTVADGAFAGKTGTLDDVAAVAGTVHGPDQDYHVAIIGNRAGAERWTVRVLMDELVLVLAEEQRGCVRRPAPAATPSAAPSPPYVEPYSLTCADS